MKRSPWPREAGPISFLTARRPPASTHVPRETHYAALAYRLSDTETVLMEQQLREGAPAR